MQYKEFASTNMSLTSLEKDTWWKTHIYQENAAQLTLRAVIAGALIGGVMTLSNFYIGLRTGWTLGVGLTSVLLSYSFFKMLSYFKISKEITVLENNAMQSVATSAGYMTQPLIAGIPAYIMVTGRFPPAWHIYIWIVLIGILGALIAFPLKRKYINHDQLPFPEGMAAAELMQSLHSYESKDKTRSLLWAAALSSVVELLRHNMFKGYLFKWPEKYDEFLYTWFTPNIFGTPLKDLTIRWDSSLVLFGSGALLSISTSVSMIFGGIINYAVIAPIMIQKGIIIGSGYKNISTWSLWGGASIMTASSLFTFLIGSSWWQPVIDFFRQRQKISHIDPLKDIELPLKVSLIGIPMLTLLLAFLGKAFFELSYTTTLLSVVLVLFLAIISAKSTGLTSITPGGAMAKITQFIFSLINPGMPSANLLSAGITTEICYSSSNLLMDIKPGYMLGAKPRQQAVGHIIGILVGSLVSVFIFFKVINNDTQQFGSQEFPFPAAFVWKSLSEVLTQGLSVLSPSVQTLIFCGLIVGLFIEILNSTLKTKISAIGIGLGFILPFNDLWLLFTGSLLFFVAQRLTKYTFFNWLNENKATCAAGLITGGALMGMILILLTR